MIEPSARREQHIDFIRKSAHACREIGDTFMRRGRNRWIDISIDEGWSFNCRETARSIARETFRETGKIMTLVDLDEAVKFSKDDHDYQKSYGRTLMQVDLYDLCLERRNFNGKDYPILKNPPEVLSLSTEQLVSRLRASSLARMK